MLQKWHKIWNIQEKPLAICESDSQKHEKAVRLTKQMANIAQRDDSFSFVVEVALLFKLFGIEKGVFFSFQ